MKNIYLDYAASTPVDPEVLDAMKPYFSERFGNPGSLHVFGQEAIAAVDRSRESIARSIGADFRQLIFTGSATEANNLALRGTLIGAHEGKVSGKRMRIVTSAIEHESILETTRAAEERGREVFYIPVDSSGLIDKKKIKEYLTEDTVLVSIIYANNEIGTIQKIAEIAKVIKDFRGARAYPLFHTDAAQALQFLTCNVNDLGVDLMTFSSHKIYGPKGIGALYVRDAKLLASIVEGGGQEFGLRSGTENVPSIVGFAKAVGLAASVRKEQSERIEKLRDRLWKGLKDIFPDAERNGSSERGDAIPNILNIYFPGHAAQDLLTKLDLKGIAASSGSACRSRAPEASYVIQALGYAKERATSSIRLSIGRPTTEREIEETLTIMRSVL